MQDPYWQLQLYSMSSTSQHKHTHTHSTTKMGQLVPHLQWTWDIRNLSSPHFPGWSSRLGSTYVSSTRHSRSSLWSLDSVAQEHSQFSFQNGEASHLTEFCTRATRILYEHLSHSTFHKLRLSGKKLTTTWKSKAFRGRLVAVTQQLKLLYGLQTITHPLIIVMTNKL